jgi:hypothetical protein
MAVVHDRGVVGIRGERGIELRHRGASALDERIDALLGTST